MNDSSLLFTRDYTMESDFCFGCGNSHIDTSNRRRMNTTDAGKAVKKIWEEFINDEETDEAVFGCYSWIYVSILFLGL